MNEEDKLGILAGVNLILSPEQYKEYKGTLNKQLEEKDKEIQKLNNIIEELEKYLEEQALYSFPTECGIYRTILNKLKALKEGK